MTSMGQYDKVVVLGTGSMGTALAERLLGQGLAVTVWNRTAERAAPLAEVGATVAASLAEAVADAGTVLVTLADADAVVEVLAEAAGPAPDDATWVQMSTIGIEGTETVAAMAQVHGLALVEAVMFGARRTARTGTLALLTAGDDDLLARVDPLLALVSQKRVRAGSDLGAASRLQLVCNTWVGVLTAGTSQAFDMLRTLGLDEELFLEVIGEGRAEAAYTELRDLDLAAAETGDNGRFSMLDAARALYAEAEQHGESSEDIAAIFRVFNNS